MMLGRWNREDIVKAIYIKVDQANEDNCGCCTTYKKEDIEIYKKYYEDDEFIKYYI